MEPESKSIDEMNPPPLSGADEDDVDLGGDEGAKDIDGNIDEDELLKDTDADENGKATKEKSEDQVVDTCQENQEQLDSKCENPTKPIVTEKENEEVQENGQDTACNTTTLINAKASSDQESNDNNLKDQVDASKADQTSEPSIDVHNNSDSYNQNVQSEDEPMEVGDSESTIKSPEKESNQEADESTKFLHVDEDNSRQDDTVEQMDTEDPFAQTEDSSNNDKSSESQKEPIESESIKDGMDTEETVSILSDEREENLTSQEIDSTCTQEKESINVDIDSSNSKISHPNEEDALSKISEGPPLSTESKVIQEAKLSQVQSDLKVSDTVQIDSDSQESKSSEVSTDKPTESSKKPEETAKDSSNDSVTLRKEGLDKNNVKEDTVVKAQSKTKQKSKKKESDESSEDSDLEVIPKPNERPKRDAAKKAESQIKEVLSADKEQKELDIDSNEVEEVPVDESTTQKCKTCGKVGACEINVLTYGKLQYYCDEKCFQKSGGSLLETVETPPSKDLRVKALASIEAKKADDLPRVDRSSFVRKCAQCTALIQKDDEKTLSWETMDFCSEECLGKYQQELGSHCANCKGSVQPASLGKYCVRFGYEVKQFCCSGCLEEFKKGLKVCSFCQKDISSGAEGFLAPVGDKGTFKDFCTPTCMEKYEQMSSNLPPPAQIQPCDVCTDTKLVEVEVFCDNKVNKLCSDICFSAYKFANKLTSVDRCDMCKKYFDQESPGEKFSIFYEDDPHNFCCKTCMNVYILAKRKIVPCNWCKVKKYNFDMIKRIQNGSQALMMCSLNCLTLYQVSVNAVSSRKIKCDMCLSVAQAQYHLTMSDATIRNFCTYPCVMNFQQQYTKTPITLPSGEQHPIPTGAPKRAVQKVDSGSGTSPVISSVHSLANGQPGKGSGKPSIITRLWEPPTCRNKCVQTRPSVSTKSVSCRPHSSSVSIQTDADKASPVLIPVPVPIFVPCPMAMYSLPFPVPFPIPVPVPVPIFLPTTRNSIKGIMKELTRVQNKVPNDPFEAEMLMMAEMVAEDKKEEVTSSESEEEAGSPAPASRHNSDDEAVAENSQTFGEVDIMQMALKMASELDEPSEDLETQLTPNTIASTNSNSEDNTNATSSNPRKRRNSRSSKRETKRKKSDEDEEDSVDSPSAAVEETKPDADMRLKYTFGVNAWKSWVTQKNVEMEKLSLTNKKIKPFQTDILKLTVDELNLSLCLFVKEVKKPNGADYAPDTIFYLCLGIQQYLFENGRIDNIFTDAYFETFTDTLDEVAKKFTEMFNDHNFIVTRVEEEHLWECKQLGAHSPQVLLSTLMFFNTKHFNLTNADEHLMLSFSHIMKHWKRGGQLGAGNVSGKPTGSRNVLLRFYPPQNLIDDPSKKKKKVYEQHENEENPLRCPVKLYEFYLSKCPESVRSRNDVFYMQPERSCVPDSPVWYSTSALAREPLNKMLNRVKMVKEINIALLMP